MNLIAGAVHRGASSVFRSGWSKLSFSQVPLPADLLRHIDEVAARIERRRQRLADEKLILRRCRPVRLRSRPPPQE
jgi:hypothetical protein